MAVRPNLHRVGSSHHPRQGDICVGEPAEFGFANEITHLYAAFPDV